MFGFLKGLFKKEETYDIYTIRDDGRTYVNPVLTDIPASKIDKALKDKESVRGPAMAADGIVGYKKMPSQK